VAAAVAAAVLVVSGAAVAGVAAAPAAWAQVPPTENSPLGPATGIVYSFQVPGQPQIGPGGAEVLMVSDADGSNNPISLQDITVGPVTAASSEFQFNPASGNPGSTLLSGYGELSSRWDGSCLTASGTGSTATIGESSCTGTDAQEWTEQDSNGNAYLYNEAAAETVGFNAPGCAAAAGVLLDLDNPGSTCGALTITEAVYTFFTRPTNVPGPTAAADPHKYSCVAGYTFLTDEGDQADNYSIYDQVNDSTGTVVPDQAVAVNPQTIAANTIVYTDPDHNGGTGQVQLTCQPTGPAPTTAGISFTKLGASGTYLLEVNTTSGAIDIWQEVSSGGSIQSNEVWTYVPSGAYPGYGELVSSSAGTCLENSGGPGQNGTPVQGTCTGATDELWSMVPNGSYAGVPAGLALLGQSTGGYLGMYSGDDPGWGDGSSLTTWYTQSDQTAWGLTGSYATTAPVITSPVSGSDLPAAAVGQYYSITITATGIPAPTFSATGLPGGLSIDPSGTIYGTPTVAGTATVTVAASNSAGGDSATYTLTVANAATTTVAGTPGPVPAGSTVTLTATVSPAPPEGSVAFSLNGNPVSACSAQPVDPTSGISTCSVTAPQTAGSYPVTATYTDSSGNYASSSGSALLTVTAGALASLTLNPATSSITAGGSQAYTATGYDQYGNSLGDVTSDTTFTISSGGSCTAAACTANTAGTYTVTGTDGSVTGTAALTVTAGALASLTLNPATSSITAGGSQAYTATGYDQYGNSLGDVTSHTTFTISSGGSCTGATCTATTPGTYTVTGTDGSVTGTATLTVTAGPLSKIMLSPTTATITAGGTQAYTATGYDAQGNSLGDVTSHTTFTISGSGSCTGATCTATTPGTYTVTGTDGSVKGSATLTVTVGAAATVTIDTGNNQSANTRQAFTTPLSVTVTDADGNPVPGATVTFTIVPATGGTADFGGTTQTASATTNSSGVATAPTLDAGSTAGPFTITATSGTGGATFMETVTPSGPSRADLAIKMTAPGSLARGASGAITVTVTNNGPQAASKVLTLLYVPHGLTITNTGGGTVRDGVDFFTAATLAAGQKLTYTVDVKAGTARARVLLLAGTGSATRDPSLLNNITTAFLTIT
jgi:hypothetical protein